MSDKPAADAYYGDDTTTEEIDLSFLDDKKEN